MRRIIVPVELGYPNNDMNKLGPKPTTFSGAHVRCTAQLYWRCTAVACTAMEQRSAAFSQQRSVGPV